MFFQKEVEVI